MATHDVTLGIGDVSGMFYHAPAGTALPATADATLNEVWAEVGYVSQDGLTVSINASTESIKDWGNRIVRVLVTDSEETAQASVITTTQETLATVLGADNVAAADGTITAGLTLATLPPEEAFLFRMKDGDDMIIVGCTKGQVTALESLSFQPSSAISWTPTITALEGTLKLITTTSSSAASGSDSSAASGSDSSAASGEG